MKSEKKDQEDILKEDLNTGSSDNMTNNQQTEQDTTANNANLSDENESKEDTLEEKFNELNNSHLRLLAEFDNYRKRTMREKADLIKMGGERIFVDLLPVIDDFERALDNVEKTENLEALKEGIDLIYHKFISFLSKHGVKEIASLGEPFDTEKHEAITTIPAEKDEMKDKIVDCVQKGYILDDKVIRFPKVIVAK